MDNSGQDIDFQAIVVGKAGDDFVRRVIEVLSGFEVKTFFCEDVYCAVASVVKSDGKNRFILGRLEELSREGGQFFEMAHANGCVCCCLADVDFKSRRKELLAALEAGVFLVSGTGELEEVIGRVLEKNTVSTVDGKSTDFVRDDFLTTRAELDALLEGY